MLKMSCSSAVLAVLSLFISGCLVSHHSETTRTGTRVSPETFAKITLHTTTDNWVEATLGPPTLKSKIKDGELWKYVYTTHTDSSGAIFLIFGGSDTSDESETSFIEFKNGVVTNKWRG